MENMSKIPFTLDAWLKDKSQKIETAFGEPAKIVFTEGLGKCPILAVIYDGDTTDSAWFTKDGKSHDGVYGLFLITPEEEKPTPFEEELSDIVEYCKKNGDKVVDGYAKRHAVALLSIAREQFIKDGYVIEKKAFHDAVENISDRHLAEINIEWSLHCNIEDGARRVVMDWEAFQKVAKKFINIGRSEALKDLPTWEKYPHNAGEEPLVNGILQEDGSYKWRLYLNGYKIEISDLEKLPGFKED